MNWEFKISERTASLLCVAPRTANSRQPLPYRITEGLTVSAQTAAPSDVTFAQQVEREIAEAKGGTTPAEWLHTHADERLQMFNGPQFANDTKDWCARTVVAHPATTGRAWTRSVYFYDPQPPADDGLPAPG